MVLGYRVVVGMVLGYRVVVGMVLGYSGSGVYVIGL